MQKGIAAGKNYGSQIAATSLRTNTIKLRNICHSERSEEAPSISRRSFDSLRSLRMTYGNVNKNLAAERFCLGACKKSIPVGMLF